MEEDAPQHPKASRREWVALSVLSLACIVYVMDLTVLHLAIPAISEDLAPTSVELLWIIDIYGFVVAGALITMGTLGDRIGRRRLLLSGAAAFAVASAIAAMSTSAEMLIATRALLGLAGATLAPSTLSLVRNMFLDPRQRTQAIGIWITSFSVGAAIGPLVGGLVLEFFWWGAAFLINIPVMGLLLIIGPRLLPEYRDENAGRTDVASAALSLVALLGAVFGLKQIAQDGVHWTGIVPIVVGAAVGAVFIARQRRLEDPFIDLELFREKVFSASLVTYGLGVFITFGGFLFLPQYLQLVLGLSPLEAGIWTLPWALAFVVGSNVTPLLLRRVRPAPLMSWGLVMTAGGFALFTQMDSGTGFATVTAASLLFSLGAAPLFTVTNDIIIGTAPPERAGAAAGLSETAAEVGGALGIAVFGSIGVALYRGFLHDRLPSELNSSAVASAMDTLAGALEVARDAAPSAGARLTEAAQLAFLRGMHTTAFISTFAVLALAAFIMVALRDAADRAVQHHDEPDLPEPEAASATASP